MRVAAPAILVASLLMAPVAVRAPQAGKIYHIGHVASVDFDQPDQIELRHWPAFV
jgi:hypothetical protein